MLEKKYRIRQDILTRKWHIEYTRFGCVWSNLHTIAPETIRIGYTTHKETVIAFGAYASAVCTVEALQCLRRFHTEMIQDMIQLARAAGKHAQNLPSVDAANMKSGESKMLFQRKPTIVEAMQFTYENKNTVFRWASQLQGNVTAGWTGEEHKSEPRLLIPTREGVMACDLGDWVVRESHPCKDSSRNIYPLKDDIFRELYEAVDPTSATARSYAEALHGNHAGTVYG